MLHKEGGGGDHVEVAWTGPGIASPTIIPGSALQAFDLNAAPDLAGQSVQLTIPATNGTIVATLTGRDSPLDTLTYAIATGNEDGTFGIEPDSGRLKVADASKLGAYAETPVNLAVIVQDSGYGGLYPLRSTQATVTVQILDMRPSIISTAAGFELRMRTVSGSQYIVETSDALGPQAAWTKVADLLGNGTLQSVILPDQTGTFPQKFFRVRLL